MRIGVFGGTFDPVHFGHLRPVEAAASKLGLRRVIFVPARLSPHKSAHPTDSRHRVAMLALALSGRPDWSISLSELEREPPSYTVDTLAVLAAEHPGDELWLLMGTDTLQTLDRWKAPAEIARRARVAAFERQPWAGEGLRVPAVEGLADRLEVFDAGSVKISATDLRADLGRGESAAGRVPEPVAEYITKQGLYGSGVKRR
jgi:nicotinate-nucleotide adenylyltransferase